MMTRNCVIFVSETNYVSKKNSSIYFTYIMFIFFYTYVNFQLYEYYDNTKTIIVRMFYVLFRLLEILRFVKYFCEY